MPHRTRLSHPARGLADGLADGLRACLPAVLLAALCGGCAPSAAKPIDTPAMRQEASQGIRAFVQRVVEGAEVVSVTPFAEGHVHETWKIVATVGGQERSFALKLFSEDAWAKAEAEHYQAARDLGWPIPAEVHRGKATPYKDLPASLVEFVPGDSLARAVTGLWNAGKNRAEEMAAPYGRLGAKLGDLHRRGVRDRRPGDISGAALMLELADLCAPLMWCGPYSENTFREAAKTIDGVEVTMIHGDLYETQVIVDAQGDVRSLVDFDESGFGDPALDVGYMAAHILLVNPIARQAVWGIPNPAHEEQKATAEAFLGAYHRASGMSAPEWAVFLDRVKAYMRLRVGRLMIKYYENIHAKPLLDLVDQKKVTLFVVDPIADLGVQS